MPERVFRFGFKEINIYFEFIFLKPNLKGFGNPVRPDPKKAGRGKGEENGEERRKNEVWNC